MNDLDGMTALVTGGAQGIGFGIAQELVRAGGRVLVADCNPEKLAAAVAELSTEGRQVAALALDVTNDSSVADCVRGAIATFGRVDVLVNNAGIMCERAGVEPSMDDFWRTFDVNVGGVWRMTQALIPHFKAIGGGKIVNIASIAGRIPQAPIPAYAASKAAVISLTRSFAVSLGPDNINVNGVCPATVQTAMSKSFVASTTDDVDQLFKSLPQGRALRRHLYPQDIGRVVVFLASSNAQNVTGQCLNVDAGVVMS